MMNRWGPVLFGVATNVVTILGVLVWGWPPANVFLLFFGENLILGVVTFVRLVTLPEPNFGLAAFFCLHYGIFAVVHGVFTAMTVIGLDPVFDFWWLGLPLIFIAIRYVVELITGWFLGGGRLRGTPPNQVMFSPYPRVVVLHLAVILGSQYSEGTGTGADIINGAHDIFSSIGLDLDRGETLVIMLMLIKTVVDVVTTVRQTGMDSGRSHAQSRAQ
ncbi:DUF6498-containing protein [Propionibacteriaceae bacterium Y1685]